MAHGYTRMKQVLIGFVSLSAYIRMIRVDLCSICDWLDSYLQLYYQHRSESTGSTNWIFINS